jgi:hypothetical protein
MTHKDSPAIRAKINQMETSSIYFVFNPFTIWGTVLETANIVAPIPMTGVKK